MVDFSNFQEHQKTKFNLILLITMTFGLWSDMGPCCFENLQLFDGSNFMVERESSSGILIFESYTFFCINAFIKY